MDRLRCMEVFAEVARTGSFTLAAHRFSMSRSAVSKHVAALERSLGARLLARTTKEVGLTDAGHRFLEGSLPLLERFEDIQNEVRDSTRTPRGVIRIGTPPAFGVHHLMPLVTRFASQHPDIQVIVQADDGRASLVAEQMDLSIRIAPALDDASYVAKALLRIPQVLVAAPSYLARAGTPQTLQDLVGHECLVHTLKSPTGYWRFTTSQGEESVRVRGAICANLGEALQHAVLAGWGISIHPTYMVAQDLAAGRLVNLLAGAAPIGLDLYVVYPSRANVPKRVSAFMDFLAEWASNPPAWAAPRPASTLRAHG